MKINGVIFDMDGLLIDSERNNRRVTMEIYKENGWIYDDAVYMSTVGTNRENCNRVFLNYFQQDQVKLDLYNQLYVQKTYDDYRNGRVPLKKGAYELVNYLRQQDIPFALATSSALTRVNLVFNKTQFQGNPFDKVVTGPEVARSKPAPDIFLKAAELIEVPIKQCMVLEDSFNGIRAGRNANAYTVMVPDILQPTEEIAEMADQVMDDLSQVLNFIKGNRK